MLRDNKKSARELHMAKSSITKENYGANRAKLLNPERFAGDRVLEIILKMQIEIRSLSNTKTVSIKMFLSKLTWAWYQACNHNNNNQ
jgi:hypothetical protein